MTATVLDVGNCGPDHAAIRSMLSSKFDVRVLQAHGSQDSLKLLASEAIDLVLINRKLDQDYSDGLEILKLIKADSRYASIPVMLVTNYQEAQEEAVQWGALPGFGKLSLTAEETWSRLSSVLLK
jgi:CheY-like chemotaxis protein